MKCFVMALVIVSFFPIRSVWAEIYRYKDADGVVHVTDNLADVPEKQRVGISVYESVPTPAVPASATEQHPSLSTTSGGQNLKMQEKPQGGDSDAGSPQSEEISSEPSRIDQLMKIKNALDAENVQFMKESLVLSEEKKALSDNDAIKAYNEKVRALNLRVDDYEKRRAAFQKEADVFDAALQKRLAPPPQLRQPSSP
jgi:hypothetical protein